MINNNKITHYLSVVCYLFCNFAGKKNIKEIMKKILFVFMAFAALFFMAACSDTETYADQRNRERDSINAFLRNEHITVISEKTFQERFEAGVTLTDTSANKNEYVLFESNGVYMQVIDQGCGDIIPQGTSEDVLVRFDEYNINTRALISDESLQCSNNVPAYSYMVDKVRVTNTSGTYTGIFVEPSKSVFASTYNTSSYTGGISGVVPSGWLVPFTYVKIGRGNSEGEKIAHVRLLVPHTYGSTAASGSVYACLYDMTLRKGR